MRLIRRRKFLFFLSYWPLCPFAHRNGDTRSNVVIQTEIVPFAALENGVEVEK